MDQNDNIDSNDELVQAYIGPYNKSYYLRVFEKIRNSGSAGWHWPAMFATSGWLLYRKMWLYAFLYILVLPLVHVILTTTVSLVAGDAIGTWFWFSTYVAIGFVLAPMFANRLYFRHVNRKTEALGAAGASHEQQVALAADKGGTSVWALVGVAFGAVPLVGIMAAIAIPAYQDFTIRAQIAEGLSLSAGARAAVQESYVRTGDLPADNASAGLPPPVQLSGTYVAGIEVFEGDIYIFYGNEAHTVIYDSALVLSSSIDSQRVLDWSCGSPEIANKHLPAACRQ